ncbi:MAG: ATP-binding protein [Nanoarchaeota archaeon]
MELSLINKHWQEGFRYNIPYRRTLYGKLCQHLSRKFILSLVGLRRTGKTTLLRQLMDFLITEKGVPRHNILYYSFDEPAEWQKVVDEFLRVTHKELETQPLYFFLDEVQKLENWQNKVKIYYDHYPNIRFIVSGSSSLFIRKKSESLAGRILEFPLPPLSFPEFIALRGKEALTHNKEMFAAELQREFEKYASRQFIEIIEEPEEIGQEYFNSLLRKVIYEDIPQVYPVEQPQVLWRLFKIIAAQPGMLLDYHSLSSDLGIHERTLSAYTEFLEKAFLIKKIYNFSRNKLTSEKKLKKIYPIASSFCESDLSKKVEALIITQIPCNFFWRRTEEVDCILVNDEVIPVEIKYRESIKNKDLKGLMKFMKEFDTKRGIVLTKNTEKEGNIKFIPAWKCLLNVEAHIGVTKKNHNL